MKNTVKEGRRELASQRRNKSEQLETNTHCAAPDSSYNPRY
jgi:hypothetical protein